ncbi:MAG: 16S rRNA (cytosine(1402)-N(4))-methyltransferase RsmH [Victivallaceae bacterium]
MDPEAGQSTAEADFTHIPVLPREVTTYLSFGDRPVKLIDGTLGCGGHSGLLLKAAPNARLLGIDRDEAALNRATKRLDFARDRITLVHGEFRDIYDIARANGFTEADGILLDIGVSSPQIDDPERGFSWRFDGPLDMRMDRSCRRTAADILAEAGEQELTHIFRDYGELHSAAKLARAVISHRKNGRFERTAEFAGFCEEVLGRTAPGKLPLPTLIFQALRIAVNDELKQLEDGLNGALKTLASGGRLAVITFHSLEDRTVKNFFRLAASSCVCPPGLPVCICGKRAEVKILTRKVVTAQEDELAENRRSAPAKLRVVEKL